MTLSDVYSKNVDRWGHGAQKFFMNPVTKERFDLLNYVNPPSWREVIEFQKTCASQIQISLQAEDIVRKLQKDQLFNPNSVMLNIEQHIQNIEESVKWADDSEGIGGLAGLRELFKKNGQLTANDIRVYLVKYTGLISKLRASYDILSKQDFSNQSTNVIAQFNNYEKAVKDFMMVCSRLQTDSSNFIIDPNAGFLQPLIWSGNVLKGALLETEGAEFFRSVIPEYITIVSGNIKGPVIDIFGNKTSSGKSIVQDLLVFDRHAQIKFSINGQSKIMSMEDFLVFVSTVGKNKTITINDGEYDYLINQSLTGVTAKSGAGNIRFKNQIAPSDIVSILGGTHAYGMALRMLMRLLDPNGFYHSARILAKDETKPHEYYDCMFSYGLGKVLQQLIGHQNEIMLGRKGVQTIKEFLQDYLGEYVMKPYSTHVNLKTNRGVTVGLQKI